MKNNFFVLFCILFLSNIGNSQNFKISKTIADKMTKLPLENVSISNDKDNSTTNKEGLFMFVSSKNEINFNLLGYNPIKTTFEGIEKKDTLFMEAKVLELKEVVISNVEPFMKKVYDKMADNFIQNYTSNFFLRNVLKKDNDIIVLQDIHGKRGRNGSQKNPLEIEVSNMRKTSLFEKKNSIDFTLPSFNEFFTLTFPFPSNEKTNFTEVDYNDVDYKKILFEDKVKDPRGQIHKGYFIINKKDYAVVEFFFTGYNNPEVGPYQKFTLSSTRFRTTKYEKLERFTKNNVLNKYYLSSSKLIAQVEVMTDKKNGKTLYFDLLLDYFTTNAITSENVESNFAVDKDIFKAKFPYSAEFWSNQNQLPLTSDLKEFLKRVSENKEKKKEFEIIGNF